MSISHIIQHKSTTVGAMRKRRRDMYSGKLQDAYCRLPSNVDLCWQTTCKQLQSSMPWAITDCLTTTKHRRWMADYTILWITVNTSMYTLTLPEWTSLWLSTMIFIYTIISIYSSEALMHRIYSLACSSLVNLRNGGPPRLPSPALTISFPVGARSLHLCRIS
jgi:hypothetical protein